MKMMCGRARKRAQWTETLENQLFENFKMLRSLRFKIDFEFLLCWAINLENSEEVYIYIDESGKQPTAVINAAWANRFAQRFNIRQVQD